MTLEKTTTEFPKIISRNEILKVVDSYYNVRFEQIINDVNSHILDAAKNTVGFIKISFDIETVSSNVFKDYMEILKKEYDIIIDGSNLKEDQSLIVTIIFGDFKNLEEYSGNVITYIGGHKV